MKEFETKIRRVKQDVTDIKLAYKIIDTAPLAHIALIKDDLPYIFPVNTFRVGNRIYWHGSKSSHIQAELNNKISISFVNQKGVAVGESNASTTSLYESLTLFGTTQLLEDIEERKEVLLSLVEHYTPNSKMSKDEISDNLAKRTSLTYLEIENFSIKDSKASEKHIAILPMELRYTKVVKNEKYSGDIEIPEFVKNLEDKKFFDY